MGKHSPLKDQPDQQGFNPSDGRLIQNHRETFPKLGPASQNHMQGNQNLRSKTEIPQEPIESLFPLFGPDPQG